MSSSPFLILLNNVALLLAMGALYDAFSLSGSQHSLRNKIVTGICAGLIGIGLMSIPLASVTGVIIDARSILLSVTGLFFGIIPTVIAVVMTVAFRIIEGGQGTVAGITVILTSATAGLVYRGWTAEKYTSLPWVNIYLFGVVVHVLMLVGLLLVPSSVVWQVMRDIVLPVLLIFPFATVLLGILLSHQIQRIAAEKALRKSQNESELSRQSLEATLAAIPDPLFEMDIHGRYLDCHVSHSEELKLPIDHIIGKSVFEVLPYKAAQLVVEALSEANLKGISHGYVMKMPSDEGDRQFELSVARKDLKDEVLPHFVVVARDMTDRKKAEQELHIAATAFNSQEGMLITDKDYRILRVNSAFTRVTGYEPEEVLGKTPAVLRSGKHESDFYNRMKTALYEDKYWQGEIWNKRKNGELYPQFLTITAVQSDSGEITNFVGSFTDITQRKLDEEHIHKLAYYDPLTALPNRRSLQERLENALNSCKRTEQLGAVVFIDLDNFKNLNDTKGHNTGDQLLILVAGRLVQCVRNADMVARLGGDEFVVVLENLGAEEELAIDTVRRIVEKINMSLSFPFAIGKDNYLTSCSAGVTLFGRDELVDDVMKRSDMAMYQAKSSGKNTYQIFDPDSHMSLFSRAALEVELRKALPLNQFQLFYQVQYRGDQIIGAEVLLRWIHPERGVISPAEFIPLAEDTGLIIPIGEWVLNEACKQLKKWQASPETDQLTLAVNVSARQFAQEHFVGDVQDCIDRNGIKGGQLKIELTESMVLLDIEDTIAKMSQLKLKGVRFSLDDFGTGYSSLLHLKRLPLNQLKIDHSFIRDIMIDSDDAEIVQTIVSMGHTLRLNVIAEGVETKEQQQFLAHCGCDCYQGYLFGRPMPLDEFEQKFFPELVQSSEIA
ncbi:EAL domain-containing protein [Neptuniibacter sp.]|uniref:EAL domain-containing protein n=1 Tax=Neptuniibacter sp. TaxID=1962643 RepID=UPI003B59FA87